MVFSINDFIVSISGRGWEIHLGQVAPIQGSFQENSVCLVRKVFEEELHVLVIGSGRIYQVSKLEVELIDISQTGDAFEKKICNRCHAVKAVTEFAKNQTQKGGRTIRRPSCNDCRLDIDRRYIPVRVKREAEKFKPKEKSVWRCPICEKTTIVGITSKLVLDHDHRSGLTRGYICDSCNTGLGRFRNGKTYLRNAIAWIEDESREHLVQWSTEEKRRAGILE